MLKTNSKKARENIKNFILENTDYDYIEEVTGKKVETFEEVAKALQKIVFDEMEKHDKRNLAKKVYFENWAQGLPSALNTCYYYNISAVDTLGDILEETEEERNRYTESQAEDLLTYLIFREIYK